MPTQRQRGTGSHLLLLRTPPDCPPDHDPYRTALPRSWSSASVQVLDTAFPHPHLLQQELDNLHHNHYDAVVLTSARSVDAYRQQLAHDPAPPSPPSTIPFFVVGQATHDALAPLVPPSTPILGARESGTGEALAHFILDHFARSPPPSSSSAPPLRTRPTLLYLTGDKNRDTLPRLLADGGIAAHELQVYATARAPTFEGQLERALRRAAGERVGNDEREGEKELDAATTATRDVWVALFSPSSAREALSALRSLGALPPLPSSTPSPPSSSPSSPDPSPFAHLRIRLAAIGPVTARFVAEHAPDVRVEAVASRPEAAALVGAVLEAAGRTQEGAGAGDEEREEEKPRAE
ncbi:uncharacterized protein RHOBADRAFT_47274 [Rhodotorula graminis WP1]|uniref:Tetrapyrrole biosynthesis uroporphyrinogen III synthase domain-containing protein n=1 Tax=Rhodotorula graminis (strain WP1) TaxID=578459 RepID=A0A0P9ERU8_RHOGW|nr:uncharacterized protein RHOBADRAFT_47274 [Rhodotorula graminis WP1]KPV72091.1 hypothetical protein RHOBADRAFT_47274 [Rhodotorula graminis WP1]